jgi:hypothetical protein
MNVLRSRSRTSEQWFIQYYHLYSISINNIVAYLLRARTAEPQKQPLLSNTRTQQQNNRVMQSVSRQRLGKHISALSDRAMQRGDVINNTDCVFRGGLCRVLIREVKSEAS